MLVRDLIIQWLYLVRISVRDNTYKSYANEMQHVIKFVQDLDLKDFNRYIIQRLYTELTITHGSARALHVHKVLRIFVNYLIDNELIVKNPLRGVVLPKQEKYHPVFLSSYDLQRLLAYSESHSDIYCAILLAGLAGLRRGECLGMTRQCIDEKYNTIEVKQSVSYDKGVMVTTLPKSDTSYRKLVVSKKFIRSLLAHAPEGDFICPYNQHHLRKQLDKLCNHLGMQHMRFHDLRHTYASLLLSAGVDIKLISTRLGHSSVSLTLDTYAHLDLSGQRPSASVLDNLIE